MAKHKKCSQTICLEKQFGCWSDAVFVTNVVYSEVMHRLGADVYLYELSWVFEFVLNYIHLINLARLKLFSKRNQFFSIGQTQKFHFE